MVITAMDDQLSAGQEPVDPQNSFGPGTTRIYFFVQFRGMEPGVVWRRSLYRDGELIDGSNYLWGSEAEGRTYFFFGDDNGFPPGSYEIRLYLGDNPGPVSTMPFTVTA